MQASEEGSSVALEREIKLHTHTQVAALACLSIQHLCIQAGWKVQTHTKAAWIQALGQVIIESEILNSGALGLHTTLWSRYSAIRGISQDKHTGLKLVGNCEAWTLPCIKTPQCTLSAKTNCL